MFCPKCKKLTVSCQCKVEVVDAPVTDTAIIEELWWDIEQLTQRVIELELILEAVAKAHSFGALYVWGSGGTSVAKL